MKNNPARFSLELFISSYKQSRSFDKHIPLQVIKFLLKIIFSVEFINEAEKQYCDKFEVITRDTFLENYAIKKEKDNIQLKISTLIKILQRLEPSGQYFVYQSDLLKGKYKLLYENFVSQTHHNRERELLVYSYSEDDLNSVRDKVKIIGEKIIKVEVLDRIQDELVFSNSYSLKKRKTVEKPSKACNEIYQSTIKYQEKVNKEQFVRTILANYSFEIYEQLTSEVANNKAKNAVKQWIRDNQKRFKFE